MEHTRLPAAEPKRGSCGGTERVEWSGARRREPPLYTASRLGPSRPVAPSTWRRFADDSACVCLSGVGEGARGVVVGVMRRAKAALRNKKFTRRSF
nr:unnamed protein product [Digitaria exilis]